MHSNHQFYLISRHYVLTLACASLTCVSMLSAGAQDPRDIEIRELETNLATALSQKDKLESDLKTSLNANRVLANSLAEANKEASALKENYQNALLQLEILASESFEDDGLQERLKKAASDLRLAEAEKDKVAQGLMKLASEITTYLEGAAHPDANARLKVEKALREGDEALGLIYREKAVVEKTLDDAQVIGVEKEFSLVVLNVGSKQGLRVGTPIRIHRKDRMIASALVVDVRDVLAGAIILEFTDPNDTIQIADTVRIDPQGV